MHDIVNTLPGQMTLQEKAALLAGTNGWYTVPVERLGIPSLKMTDGPNGARGAGGFTSAVAALAFINFEMDEIANPRLRREAKPKALKTQKAVA